MKNISPALLTALGEFSAVNRADLISIDLPNGQQINAVHGADDVLWAGTEYSASAYGVWERGAVTSEATFGLKSNSMMLTVVADTTVLVPGTSTPLMSIVNTGFFDGATVNVDTVYMPIGQWGRVIGALSLFSGTIIDFPKLGRSKIQFEVRDWLYLLNLKVPIRVIQPSCFNTLFDNRCTLNAAAYAVSNIVAAGSTTTNLIPQNVWPTTDVNGRNPQSSSPPYFSQGKLQFTSGQNAGIWYHIAVQTNGATGALTLQGATIFPVATGDTFNAYPGCSKTATACLGFDNYPHFEGMPFVPAPETSVGGG